MVGDRGHGQEACERVPVAQPGAAGGAAEAREFAPDQPFDDLAAGVVDDGLVRLHRAVERGGNNEQRALVLRGVVEPCGQDVLRQRQWHRIENFARPFLHRTERGMRRRAFETSDEHRRLVQDVGRFVVVDQLLPVVESAPGQEQDTETVGA